MLTAVVAASYATLVGGALWREHGRTVTLAQATAHDTVDLLARLLADTVDDVGRELAALAVAPARTGALPEAHPPFESLALVDALGDVRAGSRRLAEAAASDAASSPAGGLIHTLHDGNGGPTLLIFRLPLDDGGAVLAGVPAALLRDLFDTLHLGAGGRIAVGRPGGPAVIAVTDGGRGDDTAGDGSRADDTADALLATAAVANAPLVVTLSRPWRTVLEGWRETAGNAAVAGAVLAIVMPSLLMMLLAWMRRALAAEEARRAAEAASHAKSDFLALMSHELRTPLNTVLGFAEMIRDRAWGPRGEDRAAEYAADIHAAGTHLLSLLNDVLDLAKIEAGRMALQPEPVDPAALAQSCLRLCSGQARASGVSLAADVPDGTAPIHGDARAIRQILVNLVSNGCKFTPRGGSVHVTVVDNPSGGSVVTVSDTGVGMTPNEIAQAMQRFGQVDNRFTRSHAGSGLGLPLAKGLMELHGGTLSIVSAPGHGTTVTLSFPGAP